MNWFTNLKIGQRLGMVMLVLTLIMLSINVFNFTKLQQIKQNSDLAKDESLVYAMYARDFQLSVIQVQQWLTDISATRGAEGFDDGYAEAANYFELGNECLQHFETMFTEENDQENLTFIEQLKQNFADFYQVGRDMAQTYIDDGPEQGNVMMEEFDPFAASIAEGVESLIKTQTDELNAAMVAVGDATSQSQSASISSLLVLLVLVAGGSFFLIRSINQPIGQLLEKLQEVARGEGDLTTRLPVTSKDELGQVASEFNAFMDKLHAIIKSIKNSSDVVATASTQISSASEQMAAGAEEQQAQLSEVATSVEEMSAMILETSNSTEATQTGAQEANDAAGRGQEKVSLTINGIEGIASIVSNAASQIGTLKQRSEEIGEVIQVIDDIADQTNLLALNANIEAARAGDAGRGFAVVADEVRKLAERTVTATGDISSKINEIQTDVASSVDAMGSITEKSQEGQTLASDSGSSLQEISAAIDQVNSAIQQIASAAVEQSAGVEEISKNIEGVSTVSKQSATSAQELATGADQLNREVQSLEAQIGKFKV